MILFDKARYNLFTQAASAMVRSVAHAVVDLDLDKNFLSNCHKCVATVVV